MTSIECVFEQLEEQGLVYKNLNNELSISISASDYLDIKRLVKQMHKQEIIDAYEEGYAVRRAYRESEANVTSSEYYTSTYGSKGSETNSEKPNVLSSQTEISDEEIEAAAPVGNLTREIGWINGAKWYKDKLISQAHTNITRIKGKEYAPTSNEIQTAVEWLMKKLNLEGYDHTMQQALEIEKKQIIDSCAYGNTFPEYQTDIDEIGEVYYKWTYKKDSDE